MGTLKFVFRYMPYASPESIVDLEGDMLSWMSQIKNFREIFLSKTPAAILMNGNDFKSTFFYNTFDGQEKRRHVRKKN